MLSLGKVMMKSQRYLNSRGRDGEKKLTATTILKLSQKLK
jgi:hypothetical protein